MSRWVVKDRGKVRSLIQKYMDEIPVCSNFKNLKEAFFSKLSRYIEKKDGGRYWHPFYSNNEMLEPPIPKSCFIGNNVSIEEDVFIGENVVFEGNNYIHSGVIIRDNVIIQAGTVVGSDGFSHLMIDGEYIQLPHIGNVVIEDNVIIGSNTVIDRGLLGTTRLKKGCRIDNLVHISHDVVIGENTLIIANAMIAGRTVIGDNSRVAPSASILNGLTIGDNTTVGMHSCVTKNVGDNKIVYGVPAKEKE